MGLNNYLTTKAYLVGDRISLADIVVAGTLTPLYMKVFDPTYREPFPNVNRWYINLVNQPNFIQVQGEILLCQTMEVAKPVLVTSEESVQPAEKEEKPQEEEQ